MVANKHWDPMLVFEETRSFNLVKLSVVTSIFFFANPLPILHTVIMGTQCIQPTPLLRPFSQFPWFGLSSLVFLSLNALVVNECACCIWDIPIHELLCFDIVHASHAYACVWFVLENLQLCKRRNK